MFQKYFFKFKKKTKSVSRQRFHLSAHFFSSTANSTTTCSFLHFFFLKLASTQVSRMAGALVPMMEKVQAAYSARSAQPQVSNRWFLSRGHCFENASSSLATPGQITEPSHRRPRWTRKSKELRKNKSLHFEAVTATLRAGRARARARAKHEHERGACFINNNSFYIFFLLFFFCLAIHNLKKSATLRWQRKWRSTQNTAWWLL